MEIIDIIKEAIIKRKPISYEYDAPGKAIGVRYGNPHAVFIAGTGNVNTDIYKTGGVRTDLSKELPRWQQYKVKHIKNVIILESEAKFEEAEGYNPTSKQYNRTIAKV